MTDAVQRLMQFLIEGDLTVTFSEHCRTGLVTLPCECWRCRQARGQEPNEELAEAFAQGADRGYAFWYAESREKQSK